MHMTPELRQEIEGLLADLKKHLELDNGDLSAIEASNAAISKLWNDPELSLNNERYSKLKRLLLEYDLIEIRLEVYFSNEGKKLFE